MWWPAVVKSEWELRLDYGRSPHAYVNQRLQIQLELLMVSGIPLETCWAFNERWNNKLCYKVASCWLFLLNHTTMHGSMNIKFIEIGCKVHLICNFSVCNFTVCKNRKKIYFLSVLMCRLHPYIHVGQEAGNNGEILRHTWWTGEDAYSCVTGTVPSKIHCSHGSVFYACTWSLDGVG
jgi:hypothetical protein